MAYFRCKCRQCGQEYTHEFFVGLKECDLCEAEQVHIMYKLEPLFSDTPPVVEEEPEEKEVVIKFPAKKKKIYDKPKYIYRPPSR